jgi:hypothetical protein
MTKRTIFTVMIVATITGALFAGGNNESSRVGERPPGDSTSLQEMAKLTEFSGTIDLSNDLPVLVTTDGEFLLMIPPEEIEEINLSSGQEATVEGFVVEHAGWGGGPPQSTAEPASSEEVAMIAAVRMTIDGEVWELELPGERPAGGPPGGGEGRGPGGGGRRG